MVFRRERAIRSGDGGRYGSMDGRMLGGGAAAVTFITSPVAKKPSYAYGQQTNVPVRACAAYAHVSRIRVLRGQKQAMVVVVPKARARQGDK